MRQTSIFAYHSLSDAQINKRQREVRAALIAIEPATNRMVSEASGIPINVVTPRMGEMVALGSVESAWRDIDPATGRLATFWRTV